MLVHTEATSPTRRSEFECDMVFNTQRLMPAALHPPQAPSTANQKPLLRLGAVQARPWVPTEFMQAKSSEATQANCDWYLKITICS